MKILKLLLLLLLVAKVGFAKEITDMIGRSVIVPDKPKKTYAPSPYGAYALYALDPTLLVGWIFDIDKEDYQFLHPTMQNLQTIGRLLGAGQNANLEVLLSKNPDLILMWKHSNEFTQKEEEMLRVLNAPYIFALEEEITDYPQIFRFLGKALSREDRGKELATYAEDLFSRVQQTVTSIAVEKRARVYYAEGVDGLATECDDSIHVHLLKIAGDVNIHRCSTTSHKGFEKISMERVLEYNPDVILIQDEIFFRDIYNSALWSQLDAVKNRRVYLIPRAPFNWFDRPPSFMRIMGLEWLMHTIYPDEYSLDLQSRTREFYKLFMGVDLSQAQLDHVLKGATSLIKEVDMK
ncbi:MAG: ABC transporter substrate-binding protein [Sulfuricurvum sp.]|jgi:iron complex transport system substrate-binding protein